jgi:hypothetical protein
VLLKPIDDNIVNKIEKEPLLLALADDLATGNDLLSIKKV